MSKDRGLSSESFATRRAALGMTAAMTAGLLAERALSPDSAHAEGVTSVNGKTGIVVLTASNVEAVPTSEVGKPKGVAELNSEGKLVEGELPSSVVTSSALRLVAAPSTKSTEAEKATENTANIQAALNAGPGTVQLRAGTYICNLLTLPTGVTLAGQGYGVTILKLPANAKTDLLHSENWETLHGITKEGGITNCGFRDLTFNGNRNEGTTAPSEESGLVSIFGYGYNCTRFHIELAPGNAMVSEWGNTGDVFMEAWVSDFKITNAKNVGLLWRGPHDSIVKDGQVVSCETYGVKTAGNGNATTFDNIHCWGDAEYNWLLEVEAYLFGSQGEDGKKGALWIKHNGTHILGGQFFDAPVGIKLGEAGKEIAACIIDTHIFGCSTTAFEIAGNDWHGNYTLDISPEKETAESVFKGSFSENSTVNLIPTNEQQGKIQYPNKSVMSLGEGSALSFDQGPGNIGVVNDHLGFFGVTPIARPAAITAPAETTKANTEAIKSLITTLKNLGLTS